MRCMPDEFLLFIYQLALNLKLLFETVVLTALHEQRLPSRKFPELFYSVIQRINLAFLLRPFLS